MPWRKMLSCVSDGLVVMLLKQIDYLMTENRIVMRQIGARPKLSDTDRITLAKKAIALGNQMSETVVIVKPATILRWHRELVRRKFDGSQAKRKNGRPRVRGDIERLVIEMAQTNPTWGYDRIVGTLHNLGHRLSDQTVGNILRRNGIETAPQRRKNTSWASFIKQHQDVLWATDFFTSEIWTKAGLTTVYVLFFIHLETRRVVIAGSTVTPNEAWMKQMARNVTGWDGETDGARYLIHDRDTKYAASFSEIFKSVGITPLKLPARSPNLNAYAERFVRSIKSECLDRMILFGERSLRHVLREYVSHYHSERNHQGIGNAIPFPDHRSTHTGKIAKKERLGGLLTFYHRDAA